MGSGLNDKRKGFTKLCNLVVNKKIDKVIIEHKDRLTRFQYNLIEFFFKSYGVEIELLDKKEYTEQDDDYFKRIEKMSSDDWEGDEEIFVPEDECSKPFNTPKILGCVDK